MTDPRQQPPTSNPLALLAGGGDMGERTRAFDWSETPLGPIAGWPNSLRSALSICLNSNFPIAIYWGRDLVLLYNDQWSPIPGEKHPWALGRPAREAWPEIWHIIEPLFRRVMTTGEATRSRDQLLPMHRHGFTEECYFDYTFSPIRGESGRVEGVFNAVLETTTRVIGERRLRTLRELGAWKTGEARTAEEACRTAAHLIAENPHDLPFALLYLLDGDGRRVKLVGQTGLEPGAPACPTEVDPDQAPWPFRQVAESGHAVTVDDLRERFGPLPGGAWAEPTVRAVVLPMAKPGQAQLAGFVVAGISPRLALDDDYRGFLDLLASHVATAVASARAYAEERRRAEALAELDRAKTAFFSNVSHEFRTPLTLMLGPVEDTLNGMDGDLPPALRDRLEGAHRNGLRLLRLVNTLLDFSRIEAGRVRASFEPTDLAALTADLASNFRSACEKAGLTLDVDCPPLPEPVFVDRPMWEKVVLNLLSNAFKFTFAGGITVSVRPGDHSAELRVRDTGTGIPPDEMPRLFERFHRVENARGRTHEGSGIGLALVQELVKLHGGTVTAESEVGVGTTFAVSIPLGPAHLPGDQVERGRARAATPAGASPFVEEALRWLPESGVRGQETGVSSQEPEAPPLLSSDSRPRVLVADDNADMRRYLGRLLADQYAVAAVADGAAALAAVRRQAPDLILSDVMMPRLGGFGLLRELRADPRTAGVPVILLSARAGEESRVEGIQAGADDYLVKPFSARELLARVGALLQITWLRREAEQALRRSEERWRLALDSAELGAWHVDPATMTLTTDDRFRAIFGVKAHRLDYEQAVAVIHPDDQPRVRDAVAEATRPDDPTPYAIEYRVIHPDGSIHWVFAKGRANFEPGESGRTLVSFDGTVNDITARKEAERERERLVGELQEQDKHKDEFLATLAHELRNPLAPIRNGLQVMKLAKNDGTAVEQARGMMERQLGQMVRLIDDLLDVSRISRGKIALQRQRVELAAVVRQAVETSRPLIDANRHEFTVTTPPEPVYVDADVTRLAQVFSNLLNNAAKYTEPGGRIALRVERQGGDAVVRVRDTGTGIPAHMLPKLFQMFTQIDRSLERSQGGLGIGLSIVKRLTEMHGGSVEARSDGQGTGSEFVVRLPVAPSPTPTGPNADAAGAAGTTTRRRVLVVDDNRDAAVSLAMMLELMGNEARAAHDGLEALGLVPVFEPDVVLLDIGMPKLNGYDTARRIREQPWGRGVVLIALTGWGQEEDRRKSREAGFDLHLTKPVHPAELETLLAGLQPGSAGRAGAADGAVRSRSH